MLGKLQSGSGRGDRRRQARVEVAKRTAIKRRGRMQRCMVGALLSVAQPDVLLSAAQHVECTCMYLAAILLHPAYVGSGVICQDVEQFLGQQ